MKNTKTALYLKDWEYDLENISILKSLGQVILPSEFELDMKDFIFCPLCYTPITRNPLIKDVTSNGRQATFRHLPTYRDIKCPLRSLSSTGQKYANEEEAKQAIDQGDLVIIHGFLHASERNKDEGENNEYHPDIEDIDGPLSSVPISRHKGETFELPSQITTVRGICRNFSKNYYKYYFMPSSNQPTMLCDLIHDIRDVTKENDTPQLYWGVIKSLEVKGQKKDHNIRMTELFCHSSIADFNLKDTKINQKEHGIDDNSLGRIVIFWGVIIKSGIGLAINQPKWGEYALLPEKYNQLLLDS